ncbi:hypothetical protein COV61_04875 [Candidatus Micrarchaeota archaeon CG11_big_fil_rev_8_21_14_0_20_47_5]|nr:MAG: hypothetical protein AUJ17_01690 [Candidatus Micrarchaeota archaeon CG1_02_47_40]PIN82807.1 MAG: hypothetical protein COV61_04875 [Candidatus Micrarchaeota archaeon CG11_big_fil_rev_8_21_14_0_20_47_5]
MDELTFLDLAVLRKIDDDTVVERFGSKINTSFFESANLLGTLKVKGYIDISPSLGGNSGVILTEQGRHIIKRATEKAQEETDYLDSAILEAIAKGANTPENLAVKLSTKPRDIALHLDKLVYNNFVDYDIRNAKISLALTESGFNTVGAVKREQKKEGEATELTGPPIKEEGGEQKNGDGSEEDAHDIISAPDITAKLPKEEKKQNTHLTRIRTKAAYYASKYIAVLVILFILIILAAVALVFYVGV